MENVSNLTVTSYYLGKQASSGGSATANSTISSGRAENEARTAAITDSENKVRYPTFSGTGGSTYTSGIRFGQALGSLNSTTATKITDSSYTIEGETDGAGHITYHATAVTTTDSTRYISGYQLVLKYDCTQSASNIKTATLTFEGVSNSSNTDFTYQISPLKSGKTHSSKYETYNYSDSTIDWSSKVTFNGKGDSKKDYSIDITSVFRKGLERSRNVLVIYIPAATIYSSKYIDITSNSISISYTLNTSKCTAPTAISSNISIQKRTGKVTISWSGAKAGESNAINGYTLYYKTGSAPTTSSYTGKVDDISSSSNSYTFTVPNNASYGAIYYFKIVTKGAAGSTYYSDISSAQATFTVNTPPNAPTVTVDKTRIKSTGSTTVTFTVTAGSDTNTSQTRTVWYNTDNSSWSGSSCLQVPSNGKLSITLNASSLNNSITYYFRTWDGIEYCSGSTSKTITKNVVPTIGSITMSAYNNTTYTPSVTVSNYVRKYVKNINGSATNVTGTNITYQWKLCVGSSTSTTSYGTITNISTSTSLSNIDVTKYGAKFNTAYKLRLVVTDDLGESASKDSTDVFVIPSVPETNLYNQNDITNVSGAPADYFNKVLRVNFESEMTGITATLQWAKSGVSNPTWNNLSPAGGTGTSGNYRYYRYNTGTTFNYGETYIFRVNYVCNSISGNISFTRTKINDYTPVISNIGTITPYTSNSMTISFKDYPIGFNGSYTIYFNDKSITSGNISKDNRTTTTITSSIAAQTFKDLSDTSKTPNWKTITGGSYLPIEEKNISLKVTVTDSFGESLSGTTTFKANFTNSLIGIGTFKAQILATDDNYYDIKKIDDSAYTSSNRYTIFPTQKIRFSNSGNNQIKSYSNAPITIEWYKGNSLINSKSIGSSGSEVENNRKVYNFNIYESEVYTIPSTTIAEDITYSIIGYQNIGNKKSFDYKCLKTLLCNPNNFSFSKITLEEADNGNYTISFTRSGGMSTTNAQTGYYQFCVSQTANGDYSSFDDNSKISGNNITFSNKNLIATTSTTSITENDNLNIFYLGCKVYIQNNFINVTSNNKEPKGTKTTSQVVYKNIFIYYKIVPNLLYGDNFFVMNARSPKKNGTTEVADQLLVVRPTKTRKKIYLGNDGVEGTLELTNDGLIIDCGTW